MKPSDIEYINRMVYIYLDNALFLLLEKALFHGKILTATALIFRGEDSIWKQGAPWCHILTTHKKPFTIFSGCTRGKKKSFYKGFCFYPESCAPSWAAVDQPYSSPHILAHLVTTV